MVERAPARVALPPAHEYTADGTLNVAYLSGLPAGHVTYDLVGSMLRFHADPKLVVYWASAAPDVQPVMKGGLKGFGSMPNQHLIRVHRGLVPSEAEATGG